MSAPTRLALLLWLGALIAACGDSRNQLLADLEGPRPELRAQAVHRLGKRPREEDIALLSRAAHDPSALVRLEAATALEKLGSRSAADLLGELLTDDDPQVQLHAARGLSTFRDERARGYLLAHFGRLGRDARAAVVEALGKSGLENPATAAVRREAAARWERHLRILERGSLAEQVAAAEELGRSGRTEAAQRLLPLLGDSQVLLAAAAARGLGHAGDPAAIAALLRVLEETHPELREAAIDALAELGAAQARDPLLTLAREATPVARTAAAALPRLPPSPELQRGLCALLPTVGPQVLPALARAARERGGCPAEPLVRALQGGPGRVAPAVALGSLRALASLGEGARSALPAIVPFAGSGSPDVRAAAAEALASSGDPQGARVLLAAVDAELARLSKLSADWVPAPREPSGTFDPRPLPPELSTPHPQGGAAARLDDFIHRVEKRPSSAPRGTKAPVPELILEVDPGEATLAAALLESLAKLDGAQALHRARPFFESALPRLRRAAYVSAARAGAEGAEAAKRALLSDEPDLAQATAAALATSGAGGCALLLETLGQVPRQSVALLENLAACPADASQTLGLAPYLRRGATESALAARLLGRTRAPDVAQLLVEALGDVQLTARREVLLALALQGEASAAPTAARDLWHESPDVRAAAAMAVRQLDPSIAKPELEALSHDYYRRVREAVAASAP